ncbi:inositol-3-phosphate synthase [Kitasatospora sp. NBC_01539]|uniref:inositol-3-phosphate synthase n=1 Tax=Kitasatospora sp. NBC_01539 TaxID=2903577 RepID=UPI0038601023
MPTGLWLIGARGSVATTSVLGLLALRAGLAAPDGCVTELPPFAAAALPEWADLVVGGHDTSDLRLRKKAGELADSGVVPARLVAALATELAAVEADLRPAPAPGDHPDQASAVRAVRADLAEFAHRHALSRVVVVNLSNTEPAATPHPAHDDLDALRDALEEPGAAVLPPSSLYALAALEQGCPYVDFTPSTGARLPALRQLAERRGLPLAGHDGKTGETLLKSVLAPMFAMRNLRVRSWSGINLLGGGDGASLADPGANAAKTASKQQVLPAILGHRPEGDCRIDYVPDLGDFKTAWDLVSFSGFLDTRMRLEFTWHGCDSALAAPLVLDLARLTAAAHRAGIAGPLPDLAFFFKDPLDPEGDLPHGLAEQWARLCTFAERLGGPAEHPDTSPDRTGASPDRTGRDCAAGTPR